MYKQCSARSLGQMLRYKGKGEGKVIPITGPVWPRGWVEV